MSALRLRGLHRALLLSLSLTVSSGWSTAAHAESPVELRVKAAILFNLAQFVVWPPPAFADAHTPMRFCVIGAPALAEVLERGLQHRTIGGRSLQVIANDALPHASECHVAYLGNGRTDILQDPLPATTTSGLLTVHEADQPLPGGVVRLLSSGDRLRLEVNTYTAMRHELHVSAKLLRMARVVSE